MSAKRNNAAIAGIGVASCAVCCAGPILGVLAAIGLGSAAGFALFGTIALVIGVAATGYVIVRRRRDTDCEPTAGSEPVPVELTDIRRR